MHRQTLRDQGFRFALATVASATVSMGAPLLLREGFGVAADIAVAIGLFGAFCLNFFTTRQFVFRSAGDRRHEFMKYTLSSAAFRSAEYFGYLLLSRMLGMPYFLALGMILVVSALTKFFVLRHIVYQPRS